MTKEELLTGLLSDSTNINPVSFSGGFGYDDTDKKGATFADLEDLNPQPVRQRKSQFTQNLMFAKDAFDFITGVDPQAYTGKTAKVMNDYEKMMKDDDPEGKEIDYNRAKVLSQKASETDDPELKKRYGQAIKQLLPRETQGLDDLSASTFLFNQSDKLQQQLLKNAGNLAVQQAKNAGNLATAGVKADSAENVANIKANASRDVAGINGEYGLAKKDKDYLREQLKQQGLNDRQTEKIIADYDKEVMKQQEMNYRTEYAADRGLEGKMYGADVGYAKGVDTANITQGGANYRANLAADTKIKTTQMNNDARMEQEKVRQAAGNLRALVAGKAAAAGKKGDAKAQQAQAMVDYLTSPEQVAVFDKLNDAAGVYSWGGETLGTLFSTEHGQAWEQLESYMTRGIVQLAKSLGSNPSNEDARRISNMFGLNSHLSPSRRKEAWLDTLKYVAAVSGTGLPLDGSVSPQQAMTVASANISAPQATTNVQNTATGTAITGQPITSSGNYLF